MASSLWLDHPHFAYLRHRTGFGTSSARRVGARGDALLDHTNTVRPSAAFILMRTMSPNLGNGVVAVPFRLVSTMRISAMQE